MLSAREIECRRRRRKRREALAQAEREFANGGPLLDVAAPVMGPGMSDAHYWLHLQAELARRAEIMDGESRRLAIYFAKGCWLRWLDQEDMIADLFELLSEIGPPHSHPTHSTLPGAASKTIPALERQ